MRTCICLYSYKNNIIMNIKKTPYYHQVLIYLVFVILVWSLCVLFVMFVDWGFVGFFMAVILAITLPGFFAYQVWYKDLGTNKERPQKEQNIVGPEKNNYFLAILAGSCASVLVAICLSILGIWLEAEYWYALAFGATIVGVAIRNFVSHKSIFGAVIGIILCPATYFLYQIIMASHGYCYEKDGDITFWFVLCISVLAGGYLGYNKESDT